MSANPLNESLAGWLEQRTRPGVAPRPYTYPERPVYRPYSASLGNRSSGPASPNLPSRQISQRALDQLTPSRLPRDRFSPALSPSEAALHQRLNDQLEFQRRYQSNPTPQRPYTPPPTQGPAPYSIRTPQAQAELERWRRTQARLDDAYGRDYTTNPRNRPIGSPQAPARPPVENAQLRRGALANARDLAGRAARGARGLVGNRLPRIRPGTARIGPHPASVIPFLLPSAPETPMPDYGEGPLGALNRGLHRITRPLASLLTFGLSDWADAAGQGLGNWLFPGPDPPPRPNPERFPGPSWQGEYGQLYRVTYVVESSGRQWSFTIELWGPWIVTVIPNPNTDGYQMTAVYSAGNPVNHPFFNNHPEAGLRIVSANGVPISTASPPPAPSPLPPIGAPTPARPLEPPSIRPGIPAQPGTPPATQSAPAVPQALSPPISPGIPFIPPMLAPPQPSTTPRPGIGTQPGTGPRPGVAPGLRLGGGSRNPPPSSTPATIPAIATGGGPLTCRFRDDPYSQATRNIAQANGQKLDNLLGLILDGEILRKVNTIDQKMGPQLTGGVGGFLRKFARSSLVNQAQNTLTFLATLHNAQMLSNNLRLTLFSAFDLIYELPGMGRFAPRDPETDEQISYGEWAADQVDSLLRSAFGDQTVDTVRNTWNRASRVYQAATNLLFAIQSIMWSLQEALEVVGQYVAWIGNAAKRFGVFTERAYAWMNPNAANSRQFSRFYNFMNQATEQVENLEQIAAATLDVTEATAELTRQSAEFQQLVRGVDENGQPDETLNAFGGSSPEPEPIATAEEAATSTAQQILPSHAISETQEQRVEEDE